MTQFELKQSELRERAFTDELKDNGDSVISLFEKLEVTVDYFMVYQSGGIMGIEIELNDHNREVLSSLIKDFEAYNELVELSYAVNVSNQKSDLISIIEFVRDTHNDEILYDRDKEEFYFEGE